MRAVTIKEAKAKLNELIEAAAAGEDVVILRGSEHVAAIVPISAADLELSPRLTDAQARRLWAELETEREAGRTRIFPSAEEAVAFLREGASVVREDTKAFRGPGSRTKSRPKSRRAR